MKFRCKTIALLVCLPLVLGTLGCGTMDYLKARDRLNKGVKAFRDAEFEIAINYFKESSELDPELRNAKIYLATSYASLYVPNGRSAENVEIGNNAISAFQSVLNEDPNDLPSIKGVAGIYLQMAKFEKAKEFYLRNCELEPENPDAFYSVGNVNWTITFDKLEPKSPAERSDLIAQGLEHLEKALAIDENYFNAYFYINLLLREKARVVIDEIIAEKPRTEDSFILAGQDITSLVPLVKRHAPDRIEEYIGYHEKADEKYELAMAIKKKVEEESAAAAIGVIDDTVADDSEAIAEEILETTVEESPETTATETKENEEQSE